jgi:hypothetical protein
VSSPTEWVRIADLTRTGRDAPRLLAIAIEELALAQALVLIHGREGGARRYLESGAQVLFDDDGEPIIRRDARSRGLVAAG